MPKFTREEQMIRDLAIAYHAEHGHRLDISSITGHAIPGVKQNCIYTVIGKVSGEACNVCSEQHPVPVCMLFLRIENGFVLLYNGEPKHPQSEEQSKIESLRQEHKMSDLLTVQEVARLLRVDETTVRRWIKGGALEAVTLPHVHTRETYRVKQETVDKLMEQRPT